jgi:hypothetical protein
LDLHQGWLNLEGQVEKLHSFAFPSASFATFVFKIRIHDHPCNPRRKTLPADALAIKELKEFWLSVLRLPAVALAKEGAFVVKAWFGRTRQGLRR